MSDIQFTLPQKNAPGAAPSDHFDELLDPAGAVRPHWQGFFNGLQGLTQEEYARRAASASRMIRDNGVTYNVYDDEGGEARPWQLDLVPFIVSPADWAVIEAGVIQRARLAEALLADLYGEQKLITGGHMPPHIVMGHPQYLRPLIGVKPPGGVRVHLYSCDLARDANGSWVVLSSRADAPSGVGYALENRIVMSQAFPDLYRDMSVRRLASFFQSFRESVYGLTKLTKPRAVLLTPGPYNEAYFEHAYLSHYLGLALVEGEDLSVRNGQVFLKTLAGLERVDVIFRRVDSDYCDPLEFRADSALGVPGLVEAARAGRVILANALGGGVAESPAIDAYLPTAAQVLLGEALKIQDIPTVWCGTEWGRKEALARLDNTVIRSAFDARPLFSTNSTARHGSELSKDERARLADRIERRGATVVVQEIPSLGHAPALENGKLVSRPVTLRVFVAWTPNGYVVMPGGLARIAPGEGGQLRSLSMQSGPASKDSWVLSEGPVDPFSLLRRPGETLEIRRAGDEAPSRAMDNLFWLGRYAERAENLVRVLRSVVLRLGDDAGMEGAATAADLVRQLLVPLAQASSAATEAAAIGDEAQLSAELQSLIFGRHAQGLQRLLGNVERTAWGVRDRLSLDTWRTVHAFTHFESLPDASAPFDAAGARSYLDALVRRSAALSGLSAENMTRSRNWVFLDLDRRVERALHGAWLIRQTLSSNDDADGQRIRLALEVADSAMTYRYRYLNVFQANAVIDLLVLDEANPRSIAYQLAMIDSHISSLPRTTPAQLRQLDKAIVNVARRRIGAADAQLLANVDESGRRSGLNILLDGVESSMSRLSDAVADAYFQHAARRRAGAARKDVR